MRQVISLISAADFPMAFSCWYIRFEASMAVWEWNSATSVSFAGLKAKKSYQDMRL